MDHKTTNHLIATNEVDYNVGTTKQQNKNGGYNYLQVTFGGFLVSLLLELEICFTFHKFLSFHKRRAEIFPFRWTVDGSAVNVKCITGLLEFGEE